MGNDLVQDVNAVEFDETVLAERGPVLLEFHAARGANCHRLAPVLGTWVDRPAAMRS